MTQILADFIFPLVLLSAGFLAHAGLKAFLRDLAARSGRPKTGVPSGRSCRPDGIDLAIDLAMVLAGLAAAAGALKGLGAF